MPLEIAQRYGEHLAADAIHVFPGLGLLDRESILDGVEHAEPWRVFRIEDPRFIARTAGRRRARGAGRVRGYSSRPGGAVTSAE